jgi:CRISPR type IV-associated protein Csf3
MREYSRLPRAIMRPLQITAMLQSPVISDESLPIDGILRAAMMRDAYGEQTYTVAGDGREHGSGVSLPIARCEEQGPQWYYAASWAQWPQAVAYGKDHWNKRIDMPLSGMIDFTGKRGRIEVSSGRYKSFHMPVFYRHAQIVWWYVLGHAPALRLILPHCTHLGKKVSQGWGSVLSWSVDEIEADLSVRQRSGEPNRAIPSPAGTVLIGFRPSYWNPQNQALCEIPPLRDGCGSEETN